MMTVHDLAAFASISRPMALLPSLLFMLMPNKLTLSQTVWLMRFL